MSLAGAGPVLLVGAGKMGGALLEGWLARGLDPAAVTVLDPAPPSEGAALIDARGVRLNPAAPGDPAPALVLLAVKPQAMDEVVAGIAEHVPAGAVAVSIAAGRPITSIARHLPEGTPVVRAMPNTPASIGRGITVCAAGHGVDAFQRRLATALLEAGGEVAWIDDETLIDAVTAVSGSGPAYVFLLAECLAEAGVAAGLPAELAARLAGVTVSGAGELMHRAALDPAALRRNVTSPHGTTAAALEVLMAEDGLSPLMRRAVAAAAARARELAE